MFGKLAGIVGSKKERDDKKAVAKELATLRQEGRLHARHVVHAPGLVTVTLPNGVEAAVRDVSYGGLGLYVSHEDAAKLSRAKAVVSTTLRALGQDSQLSGTMVHWIERGAEGVYVGFKIEHEAPRTIMLMREIIEPLRWGGSMMIIGPDVRNERFQGDEWACLRGEGPTDLVLKATPDGRDVVEALLTYRIGSAYCDVSFRSGRLSTSRSANEGTRGPADAGSQMMSSDGLDLTTLRYAIYVILGAPECGRRLAQPLLSKMLEALSLKSTRGAA